MKRNGQYWTNQDKAALPAATSFSDLAVIAVSVLSRMPPPISQVCGPISTGGLGSLEKNLAVFDAAIDRLIKQGIVIFDQMPFEDHMFRIMEDGWGTRQNNALLTDFYLPIFESGRIARLYFISGWESSKGANWEHQQAQRLGLEIVYPAP